MTRDEILKIVDTVLGFMDDQELTWTRSYVGSYYPGGFEYVTFEEARTRFLESSEGKALLSSLSPSDTVL